MRNRKEVLLKVIAIDPGGTTGITIAEVETIQVSVRPYQERLTPADFHNFLVLHIATTSWVIIEDFEFRKAARQGLDLTPAHLIGVAMAVVPEAKLRKQRASVGKSHFKEDSKIKDLKLWIPGKPHAMDSLRHLLQWFQFGHGYQYNVGQRITLDPLRPN